MKNKLIDDFNKYEKFYIQFLQERNLTKAFQCLDVCAVILRLLEKHYGISDSDLRRINVNDLFYYVI